MGSDSRRSRPQIKVLRDWLLVALALPAFWLIRLLPYSLGQHLCRTMGSLAYLLLRRDRTRAQKMIGICLQLPPDEARATARRVFQHYGMILHETIRTSNPERFYREVTVEVSGTEHIDLALRQGHGLLFLTAHKGNWELGGGEMHRYGLTAYVVARPVRIPVFDRWLADIRAGLGMHVLMRGKGTLALARVFKNNGSVGILNDLCTRTDANLDSRIQLPFFGIDAWTQTGAVALARKLGATVVTAFVHRLGPRHHIMEVGPPLPLDHPDPDAAVRLALIEYHRRLEDVIRRYPEQWIWTHKRWRPFYKD